MFLVDIDMPHDCWQCKIEDLVFLCRSDVWSPPHLDKYFLKMDRSLRKRAERTITDVTLENRWTAIGNEVDTVKAQFEKFNLLNTLNN